MKVKEKVIARAKELIFKQDILKIADEITEIYEKEIKRIYSEVIGDTKEFCLVAFGSFGRKTMAPCSDVDVFIIAESKRSTSRHREKLSSFIRKIWDSGMKGEHSIRTVQETLKIALEDEKVLSYLADIRYIAGNKKLFLRLKKQLTENIIRLSKTSTYSMLVQDRRKRITKHSNLIEPNIKSSPGGIDDFIYIKWLKKLVSEDILVDTSDILPDFKKLLKIRYVLHIISGRRADRIFTELIEEVIKFIKERKKTETSDANSKEKAKTGVREFMTEILSHMRKIKTYADIAEDYVKKKIYPYPHELSISLGENYMSDGEFLFISPKILEEEKWRVLELFKISKENNLKISPEVAYYIVRNQEKFDDLHRIPEANRIFLELITNTGGVGRTLFEMKNLGVLKKIIPEFSRIENLYQMYPPHIYPVDDHLIKCVEEVEKIFSGIKPPFVEILPEEDEVDKKTTLVSALLHDIGKGLKKDHSEAGEKIAERVGRQLGIAGEELKRLKFLVKNHLALSHFAQRRDIHDKSSLSKFISQIPDIATLGSLFVLSIADAVATNPESWNRWKSALLTEVYTKSIEKLRKGLDYVEEEHIDTEMLVEELKQIFREDAVREYVSSLSSKFISLFSYDRLYRYSTAFLHSWEKGKRYTTYTERKEGVMEVIAIDKDKFGFLSECAGMLFLAGFNILSLYAEAGIMGMAMNIFWVEPAEKTKAERFKEMFYTKCLKDIMKEVAEKRERMLKFMINNPYVSKNTAKTVKITFDNETAEEYTIVEVYCYDRPGLLFDISYVMNMLEYEIYFAKVSTRGNKISDTFYIKNRRTKSKLNESQQAELRRYIQTAIIQGAQPSLALQRLL